MIVASGVGESRRESYLGLGLKEEKPSLACLAYRQTAPADCPEAPNHFLLSSQHGTFQARYSRLHIHVAQRSTQVQTLFIPRSSLCRVLHQLLLFGMLHLV